MHIRLLAVGGRQPAWVDDAVAQFEKRLPPEWRFSLTSLPSAPRRKNQDARSAVAREGRSILAALRRDERLVALDERGTCLRSEGLAERLRGWLAEGQDVCLVVGGADGLSTECLAAAAERWSLSKLTLPHGLARVLLVEQLYRASTLISGHPYHRA